MLKESLRIFEELGDLDEMGEILCHFARTLAFAGRVETAARLLSSSNALHAKIGSNSPHLARRNETTLSTIRTQLDDTAFAKA